jgi:hypothetical protein
MASASERWLRDHSSSSTSRPTKRRRACSMTVEAHGGGSPGHGPILACRWAESLACFGSAGLAPAGRVGGRQPLLGELRYQRTTAGSERPPQYAATTTCQSARRRRRRQRRSRRLVRRCQSPLRGRPFPMVQGSSQVPKICLYFWL